MADDQVHCGHDIQRCGARSYLELLIDKKAAILERNLAHERELRESQSASLREALLLQAAEYSRRFEILNHERAREAAAYATYLSHDVFEASQQADRLWKGNVDRQMAASKGASERTTAIIGIAFAALTVLLRFIPGW